MANGQAKIAFDGVNLDSCIKQGLELTGYARCPYCKQIYTFQIHLKTKKKLQRYAEKTIDGKTVTVLAPDNYDVSIEFSGSRNLPKAAAFLSEPDEPGVKAPCVPCSRCTPRCERLGKRW
jgi:hypothetical protein